MKHFTLLLGAFALTATLSAQRAPRRATLRLMNAAHPAAKQANPLKATPGSLRLAGKAANFRAAKAPRLLAEDAAAPTVLYLPGHETSYTWDGDNESWVKAADLYYTYDAQGRIASYWADYGDYKERVTNTYNAEGLINRQLVERDEDGAGWVNYSLKTSQYDPVVKDLMVEYRDMSWENGEWVDNDQESYRRIITRNDAGIVLTSAYDMWHEGEWTEYSRTVNTVTDGAVSASSVDFATSFEDDGTPIYEPYTQTVGMTWERTDGQIVTDYTLDLLYGNNRLSSATLLDDEGDGTLTATYSGADDYVCSIDYPATDEWLATRELYTHRTLDEYGSYEEGGYIYGDENEDGEFSDDEHYAEEQYVTTYLYDSHGNQTAAYSQGWDYDSESLVYYEYEGCNYTYDENGAVTEAVQFTKQPEYDSDWGITGWTDVPVLRVVSDDMQRVEVSPNGISTVTAEAAAADGTLYDLSGRKLTSAPGRGIYITSTGRKVYVK